jgi:hypothetical protein
METIYSIVDNWQDNFRVYIIDQNDQETYSVEKQIFYNTAGSGRHPVNKRYFKILETGVNIGISQARNLAVRQAKEDGCEYCIISADSIRFDKSIANLWFILPYLQSGQFDRMGFELKNRKCNWEGYLDVNENDGFIIDFIEKDYNSIFQECDIVRNFFISTTESLLKTKWDDNLFMFEHEDEALRYKNNGYRVGWTPLITGHYHGNQEGEYGKVRRRLMNCCRQILLKKYNLKKWITYKHHERCMCK